jgi:mannosyl-oligosaccharide alpha-1,2-mannosidase
VYNRFYKTKKFKPIPITGVQQAFIVEHPNQTHVVEAFRHAWKGYKEFAWGFDELHPVSKTGSNWFHLGLTIIDALDTALIMGQKDIYQEARRFVEKELSLEQEGESNVFEITIRVLGGLLSTYHLTKDPLFLEKAVLLGDKLLVAFDTPSHIPLSSVNMKENRAIRAYPGASTAEATTLQLEFKYLAYLTGKSKYWNAAQNIMKTVFAQPRANGLVHIYMNTDTGAFIKDVIRLGSRGDSYYEYLAKQYLFTNRTENIFWHEYRNSVKGIRARLLGQSDPNQLLFVGETTEQNQFSSKMDHLVCFLPGTLAIGATKGKSVSREERILMDPEDLRDLELAEELTKSCVEMYLQTKIGLSPEIVFWKEPKTMIETGSVLEYHMSPKVDVKFPFHKRHAVPYNNETIKDTRFSGKFEHPALEQDFDIHQRDGHNLLRPETVESLFILYRITGKDQYRKWGWKIFEKFEHYTRVDTGGYTSLVR